MSDPFTGESTLIQEIQHRLKSSGESVWQRYPLPWTHPSFRSCPAAAQNLLGWFEDAAAYLVMRDACLRTVREAVLHHGRTLVVPTRYGDGLLRIPNDYVSKANESRKAVLRLDPPPPGTSPHTGSIDAVIVACLAFSRSQRRLYTFELERTAYLVDELRQGLPGGWQLPARVPVVCVAADQQEVEGWPESAQGCLDADLVVTPTRVIVLGSGEEITPASLEVKDPTGTSRTAR